LIYSDGQARVVDGLLAKAQKANQLFDSLNASINNKYQTTTKEFSKQVQLPKFLTN
jgi:ATP phosphoribosyltransferase regulatory subunit HisZ